MKAHYFILISCVFSIFGCVKDKEIINIPLTQRRDSASIYLELSKRKDITIAKRNALLVKSEKFLSDDENTLHSRETTFNLAKEYFLLQDDKSLRRVLNVLREKSIDEKDSLNVANYFYLLGSHEINISKNDSAFYYLLKSEKLYNKLNDSLKLGQNYIDKAFVQLYESDYSGCEVSAIQALGFLKNSKNILREYDAYNLIGISSNELKNFENALTYHRKALNLLRSNNVINDLHLEANSLNNIGVVYQNLGNHKNAILNFKTAMKDASLQTDSPSMFAMITDNLGYSKLKIKDYNQLPELFFSALKIRENTGNSSGVIANKIHLSEYYADIKDTVNAQKFALEALTLAKSSKISGDLLGSLKQLSLVANKNASQYSKEYIEISDSIQQEERLVKDRFARIQFETNELIGQNDKLEEQNRSLLYFFIGTVLVGFLLLVIRTQKAKNRELLLMQAKQKSNEEIYNLMISQQSSLEESRTKEKKRIAQELHDGILGRLFGARLNLDSLNKFSDEFSIQSRNDYLSELKNIEQDIREISHDLNREKFILINNFIAIVNNLLEIQKATYPSKLTCVIDEGIKWEFIDNSIKINIYRILQESLHNINKYANAQNIYFSLILAEKLLYLKVADDGIGFNTKTTNKGIGLQNILSRVRENDGTFKITSGNDIGTTIEISLPLNI